jgi:CRP-like cAMP-binding protein
MPEITINIHDYIQNISTQTYGKSDIVFKEGEKSNGTMYFVLDGEVRVFRKEDNKQVQINQIAAGGFFGDMALLSAEPRSATVVTSKEQVTKLGKLDQHGFIKIAKTSPAFLYQLLRVILDRLKKTETRLSEAQNLLKKYQGQ